MSAPSKPPTSPRGKAVPSSRLSRLWHLGMATGSLAAGLGTKGLMEISRRQPSQRGPIELAPAQMRRFTERLAQMRGAVMKMGQLMSMDGSDLLSPEIAEILGTLRHDAEPMPLGQLAATLKNAYGKGWESRFAQMQLQPIAAASIGQVHRVKTADGRELALKIQFPGVRRSIDSDIRNLRFLLTTFPLLPRDLDIAPMLEEARLMLHRETDYAAEADAMRRYADRVGTHEHLRVPRPHEDLTTPEILAMDFLPGESVERVMQQGAERQHRDLIAQLLVELSFRELFEFGLVQTDPNFANYLYDRPTRRLSLLDFGAAQSVEARWVECYRQLARAARADDRAGIREGCEALGYIDAHTPREDANEMIDLLRLSGEPVRQSGAYDFGQSDLFERVYYRGRELFMDNRFRRTPVPGTLFLHRKFMGTFMLCRKLRASVDIHGMLEPHL